MCQLASQPNCCLVTSWFSFGTIRTTSQKISFFSLSQVAAELTFSFVMFERLSRNFGICSWRMYEFCKDSWTVRFQCVQPIKASLTATLCYQSLVLRSRDEDRQPNKAWFSSPSISPSLHPLLQDQSAPLLCPFQASLPPAFLKSPETKARLLVAAPDSLFGECLIWNESC